MNNRTCFANILMAVIRLSCEFVPFLLRLQQESNVMAVERNATA